MADQVQDLTPQEVSKGMEEGRFLLVDVREPNEVAAEAYPGGVVVPLSTWHPFSRCGLTLTGRLIRVGSWSQSTLS